MGTVISLAAPDGGADSSAADRAFAWLHEVDRRFSPFRADSEVSRLMHAGSPDPASLSPELAEVLELCAVVEVLSGGAFDIRRHRADGAPDPTGVVKGWAVDRAGAIMEEAGMTRFCLAAGGDVLARGGRAPGLPWRVGVAHPTLRAALALTLQADELAVATSGRTERGEHIVDGRSGDPARELLTLTVAGPYLAHADAYATAAFAMGVAGVRWVDSLPG
jgi:thiamine biosynthesis lipoprotein